MHRSIISQKKRKPINTILLIVCALLVLFRTMPLFQGYFSAYTELILIVISVVLLFPIDRITFNNMMSVFGVAALFFLFQTFCRNDELFLDFYNILHGSVKVILIYYLFNTSEENRRILKYLFWILIISTSITQITSIIGIEQYPLIARYSIVTDGEEVVSSIYGPNISAAKLNIAGYGTVYLLPIYTTLLYALMKRKLFNRFLFIGHVILSFSFIFATQFTLGFLLYTITLVAIFLTDADVKKMSIIFVIAVLLLIFFSGLFSSLFSYLAEVVESKTLAVRFDELAGFFAGESIEGTDLNIRFGKYQTSFNTFLKNILWGARLGEGRAGGHSAILDYISQGGIWALGIMILFFKTLYKKIYLPFADISYIRYIRISFVFFLVASFLNPMFYAGSISSFIFVLAGFCGILFEQEKSKDSTEKVLS